MADKKGNVRIKIVTDLGGDEAEWPWLASFDPDAAGGRGRIQTTHNPHLALQLESVAEALALWKTQSRIRPLRPDGTPNQPMRAFMIEIESPGPGGSLIMGGDRPPRAEGDLEAILERLAEQIARTARLRLRSQKTTELAVELESQFEEVMADSERILSKLRASSD